MPRIIKQMKERQEIDLKLIEEAKNGSQIAFTKLYKHYHNVIQYNIFQLVFNTLDAEDLTMVTFEKAFANLDRYVPTNEFQTWLSRIARNTAIDFIIQKGRRPSNDAEINDSHVLGLSHTRTPEEQYVSKEMGERLDKALDKIKKKYKEIIILRYYEDLEYEEISQKLNVKENTARGHILRAKRSLAKVMSSN